MKSKSLCEDTGGKALKKKKQCGQKNLPLYPQSTFPQRTSNSAFRRRGSGREGEGGRGQRCKRHIKETKKKVSVHSCKENQTVNSVNVGQTVFIESPKRERRERHGSSISFNSLPMAS